MVRRNAVLAVLSGCAALVFSGCMKHMTVAEMKEQMPKRPAELDRLDRFVGKWQGEGQVQFTMLDEPLKVTGTGEMKWEGDKWYLVGHGLMKTEQLGDEQAIEIWTYDTHAKKYRSVFVDSMGMTCTGEARYDVDTDTWHMAGDCHTPWGPSHIKGKFHFADADTMEWHMTETMCLGLMKVTEMNGTDKRVK
jgi:hypothetical protein